MKQTLEERCIKNEKNNVGPRCAVFRSLFFAGLDWGNRGDVERGDAFSRKTPGPNGSNSRPRESDAKFFGALVFRMLPERLFRFN